MTLQPHQLRAITAGQPVPPPIRKPRNNEESVMQRALIKWWTVNCRHFGVPELCLFSIPNGGNGSAKRGSIMKAEGQRKGAPDLFLAVPRLHYVGLSDHEPAMPGFITHHGLFLELKRPAGVVAPEQEVYHEILTKQGYKVVVCRALAECIDQITTYLQ